jgi:tetratricopeptide (TPR) repeat protein
VQKSKNNSIRREMSGMKVSAFILLIVVLAGTVAGQKVQRPATSRDDAPGGSTGTGSIRGRVLTPEGAPLQEAARIVLQSSNGGQYTIFTDYQGQFNFPGLEPGSYTLEVEADHSRFELASQSVQVYAGMPAVANVSLKYVKGKPLPATSDSVVSVAELDKSIPEKARKEFRRGTEASQAGKTDEAIDHFHKALDIYPNFLMARNDLGLQLLSVGRLDEAAAQLRLAVVLDAKSFNPQLNLGIVLVRQHQFAEAAVVLDKAISLNPQSPAARLFAGEAYAATGNSSHAEKELQTAFDLGGTDYAVALFHLGNLYLNRGEREQALKSFEAYLKVAPGAANAAEVRRLVGVLR